MTWAAILLSLGFFFAGLALHVAWWRIRRPTQDVPALLGCVIFFPIFLAALFPFCGPDRALSGSPEEFFALLFLTALHGFHYVMIYPAWQAASPTVLVILKMDADREVTREELVSEIDQDLVCEGTLRRLLNERWIVREKETVSLSNRGEILTAFCRQWRKLLNLPDGSG